uniref:NXPE C-terminal domain-containing protein n=1 Tax=Sphenodon punctatus TaxID=8508 RepID=A0A8D0GFN1_SPHPU
MDFVIKFSERRKWPIGSIAPCMPKDGLTEREKKIKSVLKEMDQLVPNVTFTNVNTTTSAKNSVATILNHKDTYCIGDQLTVRLDMYDNLGNRKKYGGDFLRARIFSSTLKAGTSGRVEDFNNGTYLVNFTLFWEGNVALSVLLFHPSEGVSALWAARKKGYEKIVFTGMFANGTSAVFTECNFNVTTKAKVCEYLDHRDEEAFYCIKPDNVPCEAFIQLKSQNKPISYLSVLEKGLFDRSNIGVPILQKFGDIRVLSCNNSKTLSNGKCKIGMRSPSPSGYVWQNQWNPAFCTLSNFKTTDQINACLKGKLIYLLGDSTMRQWIEYFIRTVRSLTYFNLHATGKVQTMVALDTARNIQIQWKKHGHPFIGSSEYTVKAHKYVSREIDSLEGNRDTVIVISLGQHFRPYPMDLFIRRVLNVRKAIERLFLRSPDTKVIIKEENTREMSIDPERFSDFHGYMQYLASKVLFQGLNVAVIDAWDMTTAYGTYDVHPPDHVVWNEINMFLNYIC